MQGEAKKPRRTHYRHLTLPMKPKRPPHAHQRSHAHHRRRAADDESPAIRLWSWMMPVAIVGLVAVCYWPSLSGPFMQDDFFSRPGRLEPWTEFTAPPQSPMAGRPIPTWSMMVCHNRFGDDPRGYRVFNVGLHAANALLLWGLLRRTLRLPSVGPLLNRLSEPTAAAITLLWAAHPLASEAVAYITQRTELFVAFFLLATLYANARAARSDFPELWLAVAVAACVLGMLSKEVMVAAPLLVPLFDRAFLFSSWREAFGQRRWFYLALACTWIPLALLVAETPRSESTGVGHGVSVFEYLQWEALAIAEYLRVAFWPTHQSLDHGDLLDPQLPTALKIKALVIGAMILSAVAATALLWFRRPMWAFLGAWFFLILAPTTSFVPIVTEWCAERRMYLPLMALVAAVVAGAISLARRLRPGPDPETAAAHHPTAADPGDVKSLLVRWSPALLVLAILATATVRRAALYSDPIGLWSASVERYPNLARPRANLAQMHYERAVKLRASDPAGAEREEQASREEYARALALSPDDSRLHYNYGKLSSMQGDVAAAERSFRRALELRPEYPSAWKDLGNLLFTREQFVEAAELYAKVMPWEPAVADWPFNYALAMRRLGKRDAAIEYFRKATELAPLPEAWINIAEMSVEAGDLNAAEAAIRKALEIQPNDAKARRLAEGILTLRRRARGEN
jgi:protein O-mannosyl-transferase